MPSSHAQFLAFFSISLSLFLLLRHHPHPSNPTPMPHRLALSVLALLFAGTVAVSRIYLNYHTPIQVLIGCAAGALSGVGWFAATWWLRQSGWLEWGLETRIARMLRMRDLVVEEDLVDAGWEKWENRRRKGTTGVSTGNRKKQC